MLPLVSAAAAYSVCDGTCESFEELSRFEDDFDPAIFISEEKPLEKRALSSSILEGLLRQPRAPHSPVSPPELAKKYLMHERLLFLFYSRHTRLSKSRHWLSDPLAKWRDHWRLFGLLLLVINATLFTTAAWERFRCEVDEDCDVSRNVCPAAAEWLRDPSVTSKQLPPATASRCRHELLAWSSGRAVQFFALSELALGVRTASTAALQPAKLVIERMGSSSAVQYGTTAGRVAYALFALDTLLSVPWYTSTRTHVRKPLRKVKKKTLLHPVIEAGRRVLKENVAFRTIVGYRRLKALPPAPTPLQWMLDEWILPAWLGTGNEAAVKFIKMLPAIGDAILEAELVQAFFGSFLASAKMIVLAASALKAARVRRKLHLIRKERAVRVIVSAMRAKVARSRVARLQHKHEQADSAVASLYSAVGRRAGKQERMARANLSAPTSLWTLEARAMRRSQDGRGTFRRSSDWREGTLLEELSERSCESITTASPHPTAVTGQSSGHLSIPPSPTKDGRSPRGEFSTCAASSPSRPCDSPLAAHRPAVKGDTSPRKTGGSPSTP